MRLLEAHATADVEATTRCFFELLRLGHYSIAELQQAEGYVTEFQNTNTNNIQSLGLEHLNLKEESQKYKKETTTTYLSSASDVDLSNEPFVHLHNHSQYSVLQSTTKINELIDKAVEMGMPAVALTDASNLYGAFHFVDAIHKHPINK